MPLSRELAALRSDGLEVFWDGDDDKTVKEPTTKKHKTAEAKKAYVPRSRKDIGCYGNKEELAQPRTFFPQTELGDYVDQMLYWRWCEMEEGDMHNYGADDAKEKIRALIKEGGWAVCSPFFEHSDNSFIESLTFMGGSSSTFGNQVKNRLKKKRGSPIEQMKANPINGSFKWLIKELEAQKPN